MVNVVTVFLVPLIFSHVVKADRLPDDFIPLPVGDSFSSCVFGRPTFGSTCFCLNGFRGLRCEEPICQNGGTAVRWTTPSGFRFVGCICKGSLNTDPAFNDEYYGKFCENLYKTPILKCDQNSNFSTLPSGYCACNSPRTGRHCEEFSTSEFERCSSHGVYCPCSRFCYCFFPWEGRECERLSDGLMALSGTTLGPRAQKIDNIRSSTAYFTSSTTNFANLKEIELAREPADEIYRPKASTLAIIITVAIFAVVIIIAVLAAFWIFYVMPNRRRQEPIMPVTTVQYPTSFEPAPGGCAVPIFGNVAPLPTSSCGGAPVGGSTSSAMTFASSPTPEPDMPAPPSYSTIFPATSPLGPPHPIPTAPPEESTVSDKFAL